MNRQDRIERNMVISAMYTAGIKVESLAVLFCLHPATASTIVGPKRPATKPTAGRNKAVVEAYQSGATYQQIGDKHGISRERVRQILKRAGVKARPPKGEQPRPVTENTLLRRQGLHKCPRCQIVKNRATEFTLQSPHGAVSVCRECKKALVVGYQAGRIARGLPLNPIHDKVRPMPLTWKNSKRKIIEKMILEGERSNMVIAAHLCTAPSYVSDVRAHMRHHGPAPQKGAQANA